MKTLKKLTLSEELGPNEIHKGNLSYVLKVSEDVKCVHLEIKSDEEICPDTLIAFLETLIFSLIEAAAHMNTKIKEGLN